MLQFLSSTLTRHLEPRAEITLTPTNLLVPWHIRVIENQNQKMRVGNDPCDRTLEEILVLPRFCGQIG